MARKPALEVAATSFVLSLIINLFPLQSSWASSLFGASCGAAFSYWFYTFGWDWLDRKNHQ